MSDVKENQITLLDFCKEFYEGLQDLSWHQQTVLSALSEGISPLQTWYIAGKPKYVVVLTKEQTLKIGIILCQTIKNLRK